MIKGTTPDITMTFPEGSVDFTEADNILVTIKDTRGILLLELVPTHTAETLTIFLTQEQSLALPLGNVVIQANWTYHENGVQKRGCSQLCTINVSTNLHNEVMP